MFTADRSISAYLDVTVTFTADYHTVGFFERNEVVYPAFLVVLFVYGVKN